MPIFLKFEVPIFIEMGVSKKKRYYLNLNSYRNWQFHLSNQLKQVFKTSLKDTLEALPPITKPVKITYTIFYPTKRKIDIDNIGCVICKFTNDALVHYGILQDDNNEIVPIIKFMYGGIDKENPRCQVELEEV